MSRTPLGRLDTIAVITVCLGLVFGGASLLAGKAPKPPADIPVKVTFRDSTSLPDRLMSDLIADTYANGYVGVQAFIEGSTGSLRLNTCFSTRPNKPCSSLGRTQFFDYRAPANQLIAPPAETMTDPAQLSVWIFGSGPGTQLAGGFRSIMDTARHLAGMMANYPHSGTMYALRFTPNMYTASDSVVVTYVGGSLSCNTTTDPICASWTVENVDATNDLAELVTSDNSKDYGQFHMPFKITVTVLPK